MLAVFALVLPMIIIIVIASVALESFVLQKKYNCKHEVKGLVCLKCIERADHERKDL